jgi:hypothetical protein
MESILFYIRADGTKINIDIDMMWKLTRSNDEKDGAKAQPRNTINPATRVHTRHTNERV